MTRPILHLPRVTEDSEQIALFRWMGLARYLGRPIDDFYWHTPNGGKRSPREASKFRAMGVKRGVPDIFGCLPLGGFHGHYIELKAMDGRVSSEQNDVIKLLHAQGYRVDICFGQDEGRAAVLRHLASGGVVTVRGST